MIGIIEAMHPEDVLGFEERTLALDPPTVQGASPWLAQRDRRVVRVGLGSDTNSRLSRDGLCSTWDKHVRPRQNRRNETSERSHAFAGKRIGSGPISKKDGATACDLSRSR